MPQWDQGAWPGCCHPMPHSSKEGEKHSPRGASTSWGYSCPRKVTENRVMSTPVRKHPLKPLLGHDLPTPPTTQPITPVRPTATTPSQHRARKKHILLQSVQAAPDETETTQKHAPLLSSFNGA